MKMIGFIEMCFFTPGGCRVVHDMQPNQPLLLHVIGAARIGITCLMNRKMGMLDNTTAAWLRPRITNGEHWLAEFYLPCHMPDHPASVLLRRDFGAEKMERESRNNVIVEQVTGKRVKTPKPVPVAHVATGRLRGRHRH